ncbi:MAG: pyruvate:ferredoxin (flavodoxin) oxidoreductase [Bacteroidales bacterium]|jgi:pyruvate-ferredoxin/flavodoxin oxidoreductase|nr:pyruvate:ferredoxin (flavodoxin) oxidoreductase [Bacteroidales bacterium]MDD2264973.1 pyruvate:ferredoxin (flavodoxin) oxidoreductase [Bacteroidales bacterium]MDD2832141.1 pyruvate:ferredoxin (flavodoxin) oxidoreductase [Bacteroidales bacterium]MDD3208793.1 pyruvate:ferredoxin (flavodoxin) oxidoreductase [Bacteroidales bacterium]MDD3697356.1 pyruvate:ferredoxin (flavodoxin) oxidoreductase [Bacteroidales bacterium]
MAKEKKFITCDGNYAAAHVGYLFSEVAAIYPITPSSTMAEYADEWAAHGKKNLFGETLKVVEMQSEGGAAGAVHGVLQSGALATTFTASQGLLLMIPNMYKIAGELLPTVFHVSARSLAAQSLSIFGDHADVMACRQTGFALLASGGVQEAMDMASVAHLSTLKSRVPFLHFFDGFRTSHEIQKIEMLDSDALKKMISAKSLAGFRERALNPNDPVTRGTAQNPDVYFQAREASNPFYDAVPDIVARYMGEISELTGRSYLPFDYYGDEKAERVVIAMGSVCDTIKETVDHLNAQGEKVGMIAVHLYRPFSAKYFLRVMPKSVRSIAVLDRTKEPGALGEPLYMDVKNIYAEDPNAPVIVGGRYGLSSKDTTPAQILAVYENLGRKEAKNNFTIGIIDDITFRSLPMKEEISVAKPGTYECKFFGLGSDGTVGANKNTIKIIGETTPKYCQAYFQYDSKKSGGFTCSHLRFGEKPINSPYLVTTPDFIACHVPNYLRKYDILKGIKKGGTFLLNSLWDAEETKKHLPDFVKRTLAEKNIKFYIINATKIADEIGLGGHTNTILQSAFFKIANVIPYQQAVKEMKDAIVKSYGKKGEKIVKMNYAAVDRGGEIEKVEIDLQWKNCSGKFEANTHNRLAPEWVKHVADVINAQNGDDLPVSVFKGYEDGTMPAGTAAYEKRGIAAFIPEWNPDNCIQCNQCAYVCPHAAIRPFIMTDEEAAKAPASVKRTAGNGPLKGYQFTIQVSPYDCAGCGNCADICPAKTKALTMKFAETQMPEQSNFDYLHANIGYKDTILPKAQNVKNLGLTQPLFEFSGACAGCGETPYIKTVTQLFGDHMMIANATGCSSIYGASFPSSPYCKDRNGRGPAWANSLFEDNAEYGLGMHLGAEQIREKLANMIISAQKKDNVSDELKSIFAEYIPVRNNFEQAVALAEKMIPLLEGSKHQLLREIYELRGFLTPRSQWIIGGDGWAYDIGYGGLDHVLASGENVNVLVLDTEVYSNTGGQSSKSTPAGAVAKFASSGKKIRKKDLGMMAMSYGYVYVAQVAMGANHNQLLKALKEAEAYDGPALIIAYSPCINHGLSRGMGQSQLEEKLAVECGYWQLYRYNPTLTDEGKNPFTLDSKEPEWSKFQEFIRGEVRYSSLLKTFPDQAAELFVLTEQHAKIRYENYKRLAQ